MLPEGCYAPSHLPVVDGRDILVAPWTCVYSHCSCTTCLHVPCIRTLYTMTFTCKHCSGTMLQSAIRFVIICCSWCSPTHISLYSCKLHKYPSSRHHSLHSSI